MMPAAIRRRRFTADDYQRMGQTGILSEDDRVELIDGEVVAMTPIGPRHNAAVNRATRALVMATGDSAIVQVQGSVRLNLYYEPQPDIVLLQARADYYASQLPSPADILLIVEIAESSLEYDRDVKGHAYAELGIREYWLVDLNANRVSRYHTPENGSYLSVQQHGRGDSIAPQALPSCIVPVDVLLPE